MLVPKNWEDIEPKKFTNTPQLSLGGHLCKIVELKEKTSHKGNQTLMVMFDICGDDTFSGYCQNLFDSLTEKRWPNEGTKYFPLDENKLGYFKHFVNTLEKYNDRKIEIISNNVMDFSQLRGLIFMGQFGLQEYRTKDGEIKAGITLFDYFAEHDVKKIEVPKVRLLDGTEVSYKEYRENDVKPNQESFNFAQDEFFQDFTLDDMPF